MKTSTMVYFINLGLVSHVQGFPKKRNFLILELTPFALRPLRRGSQISRDAHCQGRKERSFLFECLFTAEILFEVLFREKSRMETRLIFLPLGFPLGMQ